MHNPQRTPFWQPPTDLYETDEYVVVRVELAGMQSSEIHILLDKRHLSIRGVRSDVAEKRAYHQMEIGFGEFFTELKLPCVVDVDHVDAEYRKGFLKIVMLKKLPERIPVEE